MKGLTARIKTILAGSGGEILMESIVSLLVFAILITTITAIIQTSLRMISLYASEAEQQREKINQGIMTGWSGGTSESLTLQGDGIDVEIPVEFYDDEGFAAFLPEEII